LPRQTDVSKLDDLDRIFAAVQAEKGHLDVLFANAGLGSLAPLGAITEAQFDLTFNVNVKGTLFTVQKALPLMNAGASIFLTGSTTGSKGTPAFSGYIAQRKRQSAIRAQLGARSERLRNPRERYCLPVQRRRRA
jgi:NAD(P)-dependent dehydrogenase (short-subunit alcohol dehydrogenase family)